VFGEEDSVSIASIMSLIAYLVITTIVGTIAVIKRRLDMILGVFAFPQGLVAVFVGQLTRRKVAILTDGGDVDIMLRNPLIRPFMLACLRRADAVSALNGTKANRLLYFGVKTQLCPTIGVDTSRFEYVPFEEKEKGLILFAGRLTNEKRAEVLLKACKRLRRKGVRFKLLIVGDGPLRDQIADDAIHMDMADIVTFKGYIPHSEIHQFFRRSAIFVLPSIREGVSISLLEAMSSGCLCIVSDIPDNKEVIQHMYNGIVFHADDEEDLANKLHWATSGTSELRLIPSNARRAVERDYSLENVANTLSLLLLDHK